MMWFTIVIEQLQMGFMKNPHPMPIVGGLTTLRHKVTLFLGESTSIQHRA